MGRWKVALVALLLLAVVAPGLMAGVPGLINYQGRLVSPAGKPVDGNFLVHFRIYGGGGALVWSEDQTVNVNNGLFHALLGSSSPLKASVFAAADRYLEVQLDGDTAMTPRQQIASVAYSLQADQLDGLDSTDFADASHSHPASEITSGTLADARIPTGITRDSEVMGIVLAADGAGSGLNADLLDDLHGDQFLRSDESDTTTGKLTAERGLEGQGVSGLNLAPPYGSIPPTPGVVGVGTGGDVSHPGAVGVLAVGGGGTLIGSIDSALRCEGYASFFDHDDHGVVFRPGDGTSRYPLQIIGSGVGTSYPLVRVEGDLSLAVGNGVELNADAASWELYGVSTSGSKELKLYSATSGARFTVDANNAEIYLGSSSSDKLFIKAVVKEGLTVNDGLYVQQNASGTAAATARLQNDHASGVALSSTVTSSNSSSVFVNKGAGDIIQGFSGATGNNLVFEVFNNGRVKCTELELTGGADLAEPFEMSDARAVQPGMVVAIDPKHPGRLRLAERPYDRTVAGIVSGANGIRPGLTMKQEATAADGALPVALTGRVYCWCDASEAAIEPGDLLTTSATPGHAMKAADSAKAQGAILGKAMEGLDQGKTGQILVLVTLQ